MTLPTTRPRASSDERYDTKGTSTCAATDPSPIKNEATNNKIALFIKTVVVRATALRNNNIIINFLFSTISPKGTRNSKPTTYPICVSVTINPALLLESPISLLITPIKGCA
ncbi:hypothetical protein B4077_0990 [Bacillus cereus]|uniref:Uncharacterized protein n=1 Tax=Bacillus cereus TaxID=1396 RepID=A0A0G8F724_BACCE|nr:hypothetical protein B4077_0990 [Bacillus cereus]